MEPTERAEVCFDREATRWRITAGGEPLVDRDGVPLASASFSAAIDVRDEHNRGLYQREGQNYC